VKFLLLALGGILFARGNLINWVATIIVAFAIIGNDSPQLIGTYLASKENEKWYKTFFFVGSIFFIALCWAWYFQGGELHFKILNNIPYREINSFYLAAPAVLLLLTHFGIPTSSTFLILSIFMKGGDVFAMLTKTVTSYFFSCVFSGYAHYIALRKYGKYLLSPFEKQKERMWNALQTLSTVALVANWLFFSMSNVVAFLPRKFSGYDFVFFLIMLLSILGLILSNKNNRMQRIVSSKKNAGNVRINTIINVVFALILFFFKTVNNISIATTFVFLGVLAGKDIALLLNERDAEKKNYRRTLSNILKDINKCILGVGISLIFFSVINFFNVL
jgi:hypothetical protein